MEAARDRGEARAKLLARKVTKVGIISGPDGKLSTDGAPPPPAVSESCLKKTSPPSRTFPETFLDFLFSFKMRIDATHTAALLKHPGCVSDNVIAPASPVTTTTTTMISSMSSQPARRSKRRPLPTEVIQLIVFYALGSLPFDDPRLPTSPLHLLVRSPALDDPAVQRVLLSRLSAVSRGWRYACLSFRHFDSFPYAMPRRMLTTPIAGSHLVAMTESSPSEDPDVAAFRKARKNRISTLHLGRLQAVSSAMSAVEAELARTTVDSCEDNWIARMAQKKWSRAPLPSSITHPLIACLPPLTQITTLEMDASSFPGLLNLPSVASYAPSTTPPKMWRSGQPSAATYAGTRTSPQLVRPWLESLPNLSHLIVNCTLTAFTTTGARPDTLSSPSMSRTSSAPVAGKAPNGRAGLPRLSHLTLRLHGPDSAHQGRQGFAIFAVTLLGRLPPTRTLVLDAPHAASPGMAPGWLGCPLAAATPMPTHSSNPFARPDIPAAWSEWQEMPGKAIADALEGIESLVLLTRLRPPPERFPWKPVLSKPYVNLPVPPASSPPPTVAPSAAQPLTGTLDPTFIAPPLVASRDELQDASLPNRPIHRHFIFSGGYSRSMVEALVGSPPFMSPMLAPLIPTLPRPLVSAESTVESAYASRFSDAVVPVFTASSAPGSPAPQASVPLIPQPNTSAVTWKPVRRNRPTTLVTTWMWQSAGLMPSIASNLTTLLLPSYAGLPLLLARLPANPPVLRRLYVAGSVGGWAPGTALMAPAPVVETIPGHEMAEEERVSQEDVDRSLCHAVLAALTAEPAVDAEGVPPLPTVRLEEHELASPEKLFPLALARLTSLRAFGVEDWHRWSGHLLKGLEQLPDLEVVAVTCGGGGMSAREVAKQLAKGVGRDCAEMAEVRLQSSVRSVLWTRPPGSAGAVGEESFKTPRRGDVKMVEIESVEAMRKSVLEYKRT
ncbi:hypothetical protein HDU96_002044 [Phlyctochytrium bullatum]|nr:hypothetical protein HDU96_002044 [Phlyctochytrium bullatum]